MVDNSVYRIAIVLALNVSALVVMARYVARVSSGASAVWERQIRRFEKADRLSFPRAGGIVFTGSSTIRLWASLHEDMAPFSQKIHGQLPEVSIYFISIKPPRARLKSWREMQRANTLIRELCGSDHRLHYIDVVPAMLDAEGKPRRDVFKWDGIHLNDKGYAIWAAALKPVLP